MAYPILKPSYTWFNPNVTTITRSSITTINFANQYTPSGEVTDSWDASLTQNGSIMCYVEGTVLTIAGDGSGKITANPDSSYFLFTLDGSDYFSKCTAVNNLPLLDTSNVTTMNKMFRGCAASIMDISGMDTSKVTDMYQAFAICKKMPQQSFAHFDVSNVTDMSFMFYQCEKLKVMDFGNWNVSKVVSFDHFLSHSLLTSIDVENWDVSSCENFNAMFNDTRITTIDISKWNTKNAKIFSQMFDGCIKLVKIIGLENLYTDNVVCFGQMFYNCNALEEVNLSGFNSKNARSGVPTSSNGSTSENTNLMFYGCKKLKKVIMGKNFSFLGNGTSAEIGVLPTPSATDITGADGNWYSIEGVAYAPAEVPNLVQTTYFATADLARAELESKSYISYANLKLYHESLKEYIDNAIKAYVDEAILGGEW